jgi:hypothetical protein
LIHNNNKTHIKTKQKKNKNTVPARFQCLNCAIAVATDDESSFVNDATDAITRAMCESACANTLDDAASCEAPTNVSCFRLCDIQNSKIQSRRVLLKTRKSQRSMMMESRVVWLLLAALAVSVSAQTPTSTLSDAICTTGVRLQSSSETPPVNSTRFFFVVFN